ncbi:MAG TPA: cyclase family protein [Burkholderiales bacterium]|nr:cyclase family protein [Burkholderiales bacterium]
MSNPRWKQRPPGSTWGDFGPDDQRGRMNLITPERRKLGFAEVREGLAFCLSLPLDVPGGTVVNPRRRPPTLTPTEREGKVNFTVPIRLLHDGATDIVCDDAVMLTLQYSSQWDSFAHVGQFFDANGDGKDEMVFYNGYRAGEDIAGPVDYRDGGEKPMPGGHAGARKLGVEHLAEGCAQGRAVMIDLYAHFGLGHRYVSYEELMRVLDKDGVVVEPGDMVCLRTGFDRWLLSKNKQIRNHAEVEEVLFGLDGRDEKLLNWITDSGAAAMISDNVAVELTPARPIKGSGPTLPLHAHCLFKLGVHLGEMWLLSDLADWLREKGRSRFLLTAPPLRLPGAVGSPPAAVASV